MNGVGFEILARSPVPKIPLSYANTLSKFCIKTKYHYRDFAVVFNTKS